MTVRRELAKEDTYKGVTIKVYRRLGGHTDYMYETSVHIGGAGQKTLGQALDDARKAIDERAGKK